MKMLPAIKSVKIDEDILSIDTLVKLVNKINA